MGQRTLALVGVVLWISSCGSDDPETQTCTAIGCNDGVSISIPSVALGEPGGLSSDLYDIEIEYDGVRRACSGYPAERETPFRCDGANDLRAVVQGGGGTSPGGLLLRLDNVTPETISVVVRRSSNAQASAELASAVLEPAYTTWYPNGPACDAPCRQAHLQLDESARRP